MQVSCIYQFRGRGSIITRRILALWLCFGITGVSGASLDLESVVVHHFSQEDGLPSNSVLDLMMTDDGYCWIGTYEGLARFDGSNFHIVNRASVPELTSDSINSLGNHQGNILFLGTTGSMSMEVSRLNGYHVQEIERFGLSRVNQFLEDKTGRHWAIANGGLFLRHGQGIWEPYPTGDSSGNAANRICQWNEGILVAGLDSVFKIDAKGEVSTFEGIKLDKSWLVTAMEWHSASGLWIGTEENGLFRFDGSELQNLTTGEGLPSNAVGDILLDSKGRIWVGLRKGLILIPEPEGDELEFSTLDLAGQKVSCICEDNQGGILAGTYQHGLYRLEFSQFEHFRDTQLGFAFIGRAVSSWGAKIIAGSNFGLQEIAGGELLPVNKSNPLDGVLIRSLQEAENGDLLVGTHTIGFVRMNKDGGWLQWNHEKGLSSNIIRSVLETSDERIWLGTSHGLDVVSEDKVQTIEPLKDKVILNVNELPGNRIAIGTDGSGYYELKYWTNELGNLETEVFRQFSVKNGLPSNIVFQAVERSSGELMICTNLGLGVLRNDQWYRFDRSKGLPSDTVFFVHEDEEQDLWFGYQKGVFRLQADSINNFYSGSSGLEVEVFSRNAGFGMSGVTAVSEPWPDSQGNLWVPAMGGIIKFTPKSMQLKGLSGNVIVESITVDEVDILPPFPDPIILQPDAQRIAVHVAAAEYNFPDGLSFQARLIGFSDSWQNLGNDRTIVFTNLHSGDYSLEVQVSDINNTTQHLEQSLSFHAIPEFHERTSVRIIVAILCVALLVLIYHLRLRRIQHRQVLLEQTVGERTRELQAALESSNAARAEAHRSNEMKSHIMGMVSHDIRNPLGAVISLGHLIEQTSEEEEIRDLAMVIEQSVQGLLRLIDDLLDYSKIEAGELTFSSKKFSLQDTVAEVVNLFKVQCEKKGLTLTLKMDQEIPEPLIGDSFRLKQVLMNLINNAWKFTAVGGISLQVKFVERKDDRVSLRFSVTDTGTGIPPEKQEIIFEPYQQISNELGGIPRGTGIGLTICQYLVHRMGGKFTIRSECGKGSTFQFDATFGLKD